VYGLPSRMSIGRPLRIVGYGGETIRCFPINVMHIQDMGILFLTGVLCFVQLEER
jgi:hypothetical protein